MQSDETDAVVDSQRNISSIQRLNRQAITHLLSTNDSDNR